MTAPRSFPAVAAALLLPLAGLVLLVTEPSLDVMWEHHPAHFWLVLAAGGLNAALALATAAAAERRGGAPGAPLSPPLPPAPRVPRPHAPPPPRVLLHAPHTRLA